jgi:hypothetical protein
LGNRVAAIADDCGCKNIDKSESTLPPKRIFKIVDRFFPRFPRLVVTSYGGCRDPQRILQ